MPRRRTGSAILESRTRGRVTRLACTAWNEVAKLRTHPLAPDARARPGETPLRTALSPRYLIRRRSQVQVLAGPLLFSQLRGLRRLGRWCSLFAWAAPGPRALRTVEPGTSRSGRPGPRSITTGTDRGRHRCSLGHGHLMSASMALTTCGAMAQMGMHSARTLLLDRRAVLAGNRRVPGRPGGRTGPAARAPPTTTARSSPMSPLAQHGPRRLRRSGSGSGSCPSRSRM